MSASHNYPIARPGDDKDRRFTSGLLFELEELLERHGYPPAHGVDHARLQLALFRAIYALPGEEPAPGCHRGGVSPTEEGR